MQEYTAAPANVLLGTIAGITVFLGLPVARWQGASERLRGMLALASAGVLLFLIIEVGHHAMEQVEVSAKSGSLGAFLLQSTIFIAGFVAGLVGLAWLEDKRAKKQAAGANALAIATMIAVGIGLHNFAEGLAIGQSFASGALSLGWVLVIGFAIHNATEGFGIAGPLVGQQISLSTLLGLGLIAGGPTVLGAVLGGVWVNSYIELLFLSLAAGSLVYVTRELLRLRFAAVSSTAAMVALAIGFFLGFGSELAVEVAMSNMSKSLTSTAKTTLIEFPDKQAKPVQVVIEEGELLTIVNHGQNTMVFEGNGLFPDEIVVPAGEKVSVKVTGEEGHYELEDENEHSAKAMVTVH